MIWRGENLMNKLLVFGCGKKAEEISRYIDKKRNKILFYIDNDAKKVWGGVFTENGDFTR